MEKLNMENMKNKIQYIRCEKCDTEFLIGIYGKQPIGKKLEFDITSDVELCPICNAICEIKNSTE